MVTGSFDRFVDTPHRGKSSAQLQTLGVDALKGVSAVDKGHLEAALGISTVADLASSRFVRNARAIAEDAADLDHDPGPDIEWARLFAAAPLATYEAHPGEFRLDFGPIFYRGRLDGTARVLMVGQDPAANELIGHRAFVGTSGQRVQGFLRRLGIARDYVMVNTYLYPVYGQFFGTLAALSQHPEILGFRNAVFDRIAAENPLEAVITVGNAARDALERWPGGAGYTVRHITHPSALDHAALLANWNEALTALRSAVSPEAGTAPDTSTYGTDFVVADQVPIPRRDLPFGVPSWHGVGTRATRARDEDGGTDPKRIVWKAP